MDKKLLILGGKPIGAVEIAEAAKKRGIYTIVADYLPIDESPAKRIADEAWDISTADLEGLRKKCLDCHVDGVIAGVHEFNIKKSIELAEILKLPKYCTLNQWDICVNKKKFKKMCVDNGIDVSKDFLLEKVVDNDFPVICKPADGSGSRGFSICRNFNELIIAYKKAQEISETQDVLIEEYNPFDSVIIHYTIIDGEPYFSGMSDKNSMLLNGKGSVMAMQQFPAKHLEAYLEELNEKVVGMFKRQYFKNGVCWIEAFDNNGKFIFNEMGYRFGGSLTYYPVKYYTDFDQLDYLIDLSLGVSDGKVLPKKEIVGDKKYAIFPLHVRAGTIQKIKGIEAIKALKNVYAYVPVHFEGDKIEEWGSAQQVFCYLHLIYNSLKDLKNLIDTILTQLSVEDSNKSEMLFCLFDLTQLDVKQ